MVIPDHAPVEAGLFPGQATADAHRGSRLTADLLFSTEAANLDTATSYDQVTWGVLAMTNDGLVGFKRVGGSEGAQLVPDLAASLPMPIDSACARVSRNRRDPRREEAFRVAIPGKQLRLPPVPGERVRVEVVRVARAESLRRFREVDHRLTLDLALVTAKTPVTKMERFVDKDECPDGTLPCRNLNARDVERSFADQRRQHGEILPHVRVRPVRLRVTIRIPLPFRSASHLADAE